MHDVTVSKEKVSENENVSLDVTVSAPADVEECSDEVSLQAPSFDTSSELKQRVKVSRSIRENDENAHWPLAPEKSGTYNLEVKSREDFEAVEVNVTNALGLSPRTTLLFSVANIVLGPLLTVPYWLEDVVA